MDKAAVVKFIYEHYLAGDSLRMIKDRLDSDGILNPKGEPEWQVSTIKAILINEKYCGDALGQKTFKENVIGGKVQKNNGQLPQVLVQNNHPAIVKRKQFYEVQEEMKRRTAAKSPSAKASTGRTSYASKYALSERLICGECGTLYRRCTWNIRGKKKVVWRCVSRLDYGTKYCHESPTMEETALQTAIMEAINSQIPAKEHVTGEITEAFMLLQRPENDARGSLDEVRRRIRELTAEFDRLFDEDGSEETCSERFAQITEELGELKKQQETLAAQLRNNQGVQAKIQNLTASAEQMDHQVTEWDEEAIRQLVHTVEVISADKIRVVLTDGTVVMQQIRS